MQTAHHPFLLGDTQRAAGCVPMVPLRPRGLALEQALGLQARFHGHPPPVYRPWAGRDGHCQAGSRAQGPRRCLHRAWHGLWLCGSPTSTGCRHKGRSSLPAGSSHPKASVSSRPQQARVQAWLAWAGAPAVGRVDAGEPPSLWAGCLFSEQRSTWAGGWVSLWPPTSWETNLWQVHSQSRGRASIPLQPCVSITAEGSPTAGESGLRQPPVSPAQAGRPLHVEPLGAGSVTGPGPATAAASF